MRFLIISALLPPVIMLLLVYTLDKREKEPTSLLFRLFFRGAIAVLPIIILEVAGELFAAGFHDNESLYIFLLYFVIPGFAEEGMKYNVLKKQTWNNENFNCRFDAIVYAVFVSLGFAAVENVSYVLQYGFGTAVVRAFLSIPGHMSFGVIMGHYYSKAKENEQFGSQALTRKFCKRSWLYAAVAHGLYDYILIANGGLLFVLYFTVMLVFSLKLLFKGSKNDGPIR